MRETVIKKRVFQIISKAEKGDCASTIFDWTIMILIALSVLMIILESFKPLRDKYGLVFGTFEVISVGVFSVEYLLRIWTADLLYPDAKRPYLKYIFSIMALIDLAAILPSFLPFVAADLRFLRMVRLLRLLRLLRVLKLGRYFDAWLVILRVIKTSGPQLVMSVVLCFFVMLFSAIVMYEVEYPVQPEQFPNVLAALWWALCTLTTVGYGDVYPITAGGKFLASVISLVGIGIIAIPTGIIAAGFMKAIDKEGKGKKKEEAQLTEEELLALHSKTAKELAQYGYQITIGTANNKKE